MYHKQGTDLVNVDKELVRKQGTKVIQRDFSKIVDGKIRHDSDAISLAIMQIVLSDIRYSLKDKKVMTLALEAVLRKHKKIQNIKDRKLRKAERNTRKKNDKLVKKLRKQGKTEKEIQDIIFREISTKEELINNIEQKERQKVKGESTTSRFIEKYNDRINAIKEADKKESPEEKKLFENFFKKTRKIDNTKKVKKVDEKQENKNNDTKKENITEEETKFNTISIHALLDRKTKGNTETVKTVTNNVTEVVKEENPRKEKVSDIYTGKNKEIDVEKEVERLENKIIEDTENKVSKHISLNKIIEDDMNINLKDYFKKPEEFQDEEKEKKRSLNKLREEFRESLKEEKIEKLKQELYELRIEREKKPFEFEVEGTKYLQGNRTIDQSNITKILFSLVLGFILGLMGKISKGQKLDFSQVMTDLMATEYSNWKFYTENGTEKYVNVSVQKFIEMSEIMRKHTTASMVAETTLSHSLENKTVEELKTFDAESEYNKLFDSEIKQG